MIEEPRVRQQLSIKNPNFDLISFEVKTQFDSLYRVVLSRIKLKYYLNILMPYLDVSS